MHITLRGKRWELIFTNKIPKDLDGQCDGPMLKKRKMKIDSRIGGQRKLETLIHEMLHACYWDLDEDTVADGANDIARALWRLGYRGEENTISC